MRLVRALGIGVTVGAGTSAIEQVGPDNLRVTLSNGEVLDAALLVFSAGVRPRDELARAAGLEIGERGGVVCDLTCAVWVRRPRCARGKRRRRSPDRQTGSRATRRRGGRSRPSSHSLDRQILRCSGGFDDHGGGLDHGNRQTPGLEFQFACRLRAHQGHDLVRSALHLDLRHDRIAEHVGDQADESIPRRAADARAGWLATVVRYCARTRRGPARRSRRGRPRPGW